jgi:hypothetical protein
VKRLVAIWLCLFPVVLVLRPAISAYFFRYLDLRYEPFLQLVTVPVAQAIVLWAITRDARSASIAEPAKLVWRAPALLALLAVDAAILVVGWAYRRDPVLAMTGTLPLAYAGAKAMVAGGGFLRLAAAESFLRRRAVFVLFGAGLIALGSTYFVDWLALVPNLVLRRRPRVIRWSVVYGLLFATAIGVLFRAQTLLEDDRPAAAGALDVAAALALFAVIPVVSNLFLRAYVIEPWASLVKTCSSLCFTALLIAALLPPRYRATTADRRPQAVES